MEIKQELKNQIYNEDYRNQFHFSPKIGWMNDVNGLWYKDGVYHLTYQADEEHLSPVCIGWGHAISRDMLHWQQLPMALKAGKNTVGQAYSGSVIIDKDNTAGFGKDKVFLIYTDTELGQCMNYLDEKTGEFIPYENNPIVKMDEAGIKAGLEPAAQRDPKVFWDDNSQSWIMIVFRERDEKYGEYLQVYSSENLRDWKRLDDFAGDGFRECPNIYPLLLENGERKWVLQSASGRYCIGYFDGEHLIVEQDEKKRLLFGQDAYAGQTFVGLPEGRIVYMCWLDNWGGTTVNTEPWRNAASVPFELSLKELSDGSYHVFAEPIKELNDLYYDSISFDNKKINANKNVFENCTAKQFNAELLIDLSNSNSKEIKLGIKGKEIVLDLKALELASNISVTDEKSWVNGICRVPFCIEDKKLNIRLLADSDSIEIIFGNGKTVYFEEYGFSTEKTDFSVTADGTLTVEKAVFNRIKSVWKSGE